LSTVSSPKTIDELDCSTPIGRTGASKGSWPLSSTRWKRKVPFAPSSVLSASIWRISSRTSSGSATASTAVQSSVAHTTGRRSTCSAASRTKGSW
jgi:hypothetical protein